MRLDATRTFRTLIAGSSNQRAVALVRAALRHEGMPCSRKVTTSKLVAVARRSIRIPEVRASLENQLFRLRAIGDVDA